MNPFLDTLTIEQLDGESLELAEVIGIEAFKKLIAVYGGSMAAPACYISLPLSNFVPVCVTASLSEIIKGVKKQGVWRRNIRYQNDECARSY